MSEIADLIKELNIPSEKMQELAQKIQQNPMSALGMVQELNIPPAILQKIMGIIMTNPQAIESFAKEMGFSGEQMQLVKNQMQGIKQNNNSEAIISKKTNDNGEPTS